MENLIVDPEFRHIIPPLSNDEYAQLKANILAEGKVHDPIITWDNIIIDGHHRWEILKEHPDIPYEVEQMEFENRYEVISWICRNQIGRRSIDKNCRDKLIAIDAKAMSHAGGDRRSDLYRKEDESRTIESRKNQKCQNGTFENDKKQADTADTLADIYHVSHRTVDRAIAYDKGVEAADKISPGFRDAIENHEIAAPKEVVQNLHKAPVEIQEKVVGEINKTKEAKDAKERKQHIENARNYLEVTKTLDETLPHFSISLYKGMLDKSLEGIENLLNRPLVQLHPEMLETEEGREVAKDALKKAHEIISTYETEVVGTYERN